MENLRNFTPHFDNAIDWLWQFVPDLVTAIIILIAGWWIIKFINRMVRRFFTEKDYDQTLELFLQKFINVGLKVILFVLVVTQLGVKSSSLIAIIGAAGLAIGLALQGSLSNFAGGILILLFKPFKVGDWISAQGLSGTVKEISIFTTKLNTFGNQIAIIPNGVLSNNNIVNYNGEKTRRDQIMVDISYDSSIKRAKELLLEICNSHKDILKDPEPVVYVGKLGDNSVQMDLRFWAENEFFWDAHWDVMETLKLRFDEEGITIPFPQLDVHTSN